MKHVVTIIVVMLAAFSAWLANDLRQLRASLEEKPESPCWCTRISEPLPAAAPCKCCKCEACQCNAIEREKAKNGTP